VNAVTADREGPGSREYDANANSTKPVTARAGAVGSDDAALEPADLIREARRRQRRRWLLIGLTVTVVVAASGG
jgi:hypothetical protein